jgi:hypothetical protein
MNNILYIIKRNTSPENYESLMEGFSNFKRTEYSKVKETSAILAQALRQKNYNPQTTDLRNIPKGIMENLATFTPEAPSLTEGERDKASQAGFRYKTKAGKAQATEDLQALLSSSSSASSTAQGQDQKQTDGTPGVIDTLPSSDGMDTQEDEKSAGNQTGEPMDIDTSPYQYSSNNSNKRARDNTSEDDKGNPNPAPKKVKIDGGPNTQGQER